MTLRGSLFHSARCVGLTIALVQSASCTEPARERATADAARTEQKPSPAHIAEAGVKARDDAACAASGTSDFGQQFVHAARAIAPSVVSVTTDANFPSRETSPADGTPFELYFHGMPRPDTHQQRPGVGNGTIIDAQGHILTNNHLLGGASHARVVLADGHELDATVIGTDPHTDLAVIAIDPAAASIQPAVLGDSDALEVGQWVLACGSPFGLKQIASAGIVSALGRGNVGISEYEDFVQTDAAIHRGNSGGPLVDLSGRVVGINTVMASRTGAEIGFAIPIKMAAQVLQQLLDHGKVVRGYIGLYLGDVTPRFAQAFAYPGPGGALVEDVTPAAPGARAGIEAGDIIAERDGKPVSSAAHLRNGIAARPPGTTTSLKLWRDGKWLTIAVKLGEVPGESHSAVQGAGPAAEPRWGVQLVDVPRAAEEHAEGMPDHGAMVQDVKSDSAASNAGLRIADVLVDIDGKRVNGASDAQRLLETAKGLVRLRVVRDGHGLFLVMSQASD
jgi:serine protease Do